MERRKLGSLEVSVVGLGCNNFGRKCDENETAEVVKASLDQGINFFDTADVYGGGLSETYLGSALSEAREQVIIATKFGHPMGSDEGRGGSPAYIKKAIDASLSRLGTDYVDLYQLHVPDESVPIEDTLGALSDLVEKGKVREIGNSNFNGQQMRDADTVSRQKSLHRFVSAQNHYSLLHREPEEGLFSACQDLGIGLLPYFPLAGGLLTGKYKSLEPPAGTRMQMVPTERRSQFLNNDNLRIVASLEEYATSHGYTVLDLAISWLASDPLVRSVIAGATSAQQVETNVLASRWVMSDDQLKEIQEVVMQSKAT